MLKADTKRRSAAEYMIRAELVSGGLGEGEAEEKRWQFDGVISALGLEGSGLFCFLLCLVWQVPGRSFVFYTISPV